MQKCEHFAIAEQSQNCCRNILQWLFQFHQMKLLRCLWKIFVLYK